MSELDILNELLQSPRVRKVMKAYVVKAYRRGVRAGERAGRETAQLEFDTLLERMDRLKSLNGTTGLFKEEARKISKAWQESAHPRDHGRFSSTPGAAGGSSSAPHGSRIEHPADNKARTLAAHIEKVPHTLRQKVTAFVRGKYEKLAHKFGDKGAKAILAASVLMLPVPVPFASMIPIALAHAVVGIRDAAASLLKSHLPHEQGEPSHEELDQAARELLYELHAEVDEDQPDIDADEQVDDEHNHTLAAAMMQYAHEAREHGTDPTDGLHALAEFASNHKALRLLMGEEVHKAFDESKHPRDKQGRFISKHELHAAKADPTKAAELRKRVDPADAGKLDKILSGEVDPGHTKRSERDTAVRDKRATKAASKEAAKDVLNRIRLNKSVTPDDILELRDHLPALTVDELRLQRQAFGASWNGARVKADMVSRLIDHAWDASGAERPIKLKDKGPRKASQSESLYQVVRDFGGIDPDSDALKAIIGDKVIGGAREYGLSLGLFRKGGNKLDGLAQELEGSGHFSTPPERSAPEYLVELLQKGAYSRHADLSKEYERADDDYWRKQQEAADLQQSEIDRAVSSGEEAGISEAADGNVADSGERLGDAAEPEGEVDTSFDFGEFEPSAPPTTPDEPSSTPTASNSGKAGTTDDWKRAAEARMTDDEKRNAAENYKHGVYLVDMPVDMLSRGNKVSPAVMERLERMGGNSEPGETEIWSKPDGSLEYHVNDGNHRVEYARKHGQKTVPMYVAPEKPGQIEELHKHLSSPSLSDPTPSTPDPESARIADFRQRLDDAMENAPGDVLEEHGPEPVAAAKPAATPPAKPPSAHSPEEIERKQAQFRTHLATVFMQLEDRNRKPIPQSVKSDIADRLAPTTTPGRDHHDQLGHAVGALVAGGHIPAHELKNPDRLVQGTAAGELPDELKHYGAGGKVMPSAAQETKDTQPAPEASEVHSASVVVEDRNGKKEKLVTWPFHSQTARAIRDGSITADELKSRFAALTADPVATKAHLAEQLKKAGLRSPEKIRSQASDIYERAMRTLTLGQSISYHMPLSGGAEAWEKSKMDAYKEAMAGVTDDHVKEKAAEYAAGNEDRKKRLEASQKALSNPETGDEFRHFIERKGEGELSGEQRVRWDDIQATERRARDAADMAKRATVAAVNTGGVGHEIHEGFHSKHQKPIHIVKLGGRVDGDTFKTLAESARKLGGNYQQNSKWTRGASPDGFNFDTREQAERFGQLLSGQSVSRLDDWEAARGESLQSTAERLRGLADRTKSAAEESISQERRTNTARRAEMAASAEAGARKKKAFAETAERVADAIASGEAKHLQGVRAGTHLEALDTALQRGMYARDRKLDTPHHQAEGRPPHPDDIEHAQYPHPWFTGGDLYRLAGSMKQTPGAKRLGERVRKLADQVNKEAEKTGHDGRHITDGTILEELSDVARNPSSYGLDKFQGDMMKYRLNDYMRLQAADIKSPAELRAALREYLPLKQKPTGADPIKTAERALIGRKIPGFFPTPRPAIDEMISRADIQSGHSVLEPSAGKGDILDAVKELHPDAQTHAVEPVGDLRGILNAKGHNLVGSDFLEHTGKYDRVLMNPPFENGQDIDHVRYAYGQLNPGGRLVAIMSEGAFSRSDSKATDFRNWIESVDGEHEQMPEGSFAGSDAFRQTGVRTRMVTIQKPE